MRRRKRRWMRSRSRRVWKSRMTKRAVVEELREEFSNTHEEEEQMQEQKMMRT